MNLLLPSSFRRLVTVWKEHSKELCSWMKWIKSVVYQACIIFEMLVVKVCSRAC